jgi:hypothetical protein
MLQFRLLTLDFHRRLLKSPPSASRAYVRIASECFACVFDDELQLYRRLLKAAANYPTKNKKQMQAAHARFFLFAVAATLLPTHHGQITRHKRRVSRKPARRPGKGIKARVPFVHFLPTV